MIDSALAALLGPVSCRDFFRENFGRGALHVSGSMKQRMLFSWDQLNDILNNHKELPSGVKVLAEGKETIPHDYLTLLRDVRSGLTMFFEDVDRYDPSLSEFLACLSRELRSRTRFNMYLSSPGQQGRKLHYDTHDVFIVQVEGRKRWQIYDITDPEPIYTRKNHDSEPPKEGGPYLDCTLEKGDVLYLPRGHWHNVTPLDTLSLHLTLGIFVPNGIDFLLWLVDECTEIVGARANLPLRAAFETEAEYAMARSTALSQVVTLLSERAASTETVEEYERFTTASLPNRAPFNFPYSTARSDLMPSPHDVLTASNRSVPIVISTSSAEAQVVYSNRVVSIPTELIASARRMLNGAPFTASEVESEVAADGATHLRDLMRVFVSEGLVRRV